MRHLVPRHLTPLVLGIALFSAACSTDSVLPVAPTAEAVPIESHSPLFAKAGTRTESLLACPTTAAASATAVIDSRGGTLSVAGHGLYVPPGAVKKSTRFTMIVPASSVLEVDISADGKRNYKFKSPVQVRLSYARCPSVPADLVGWWIEGGAKGNRGTMPSVNDPSTQSVWITTDHLSGYAIAYRGGRGGGEDDQEPR